MGLELIPGKTTHIRDINGMNVKCVYASEVKHLLWEVDGKVNEIAPKECSTLKAQFPVEESLRATKDQKVTMHLRAKQIPLVSNNACTGHKLQGSSVDNLYIPSWSYQTNWPYVLISRVRTLNGLYLGKPLDPTMDFSVPERLTGMLRMFRRHKSPAEFNYDSLILER